MVLRPCAMPPKQPMVLGGPAHGFKTMYGEICNVHFYK